MDELKLYVNKIHSNLQERFKSVEVKELSSKKWGNYLQIEVNENYLVKMIVPYSQIGPNNLNWSYSSNPDDEKSSLVERSSSISNISKDVDDIIKNKRFDKKYLGEKVIIINS